MTPKFEVYIIVQKPVSEVFDAVYNPKKLSSYFVTGGASAPLNEGSTVQWEFGDFPGPFPVQVKQVISNQQISFAWESSEGGKNNSVDFFFEELNPQETKVRVSEAGWSEGEKGMSSAFGNCMGWAQMLSAMKAFVEYGINLRKGAYKAIADY